MYGYPDYAIGPESSREAPGQRAAWHQAFAAFGPADGPDVRAMPDGWLWLLRDTYAAQTAWAPRHTGKDLRLARLGAFDASPGELPSPARPLPAARTHPRQGHDRLAGMGRATIGSRYLAIAADTELRRRHPGQTIEPLLSAEPAVSVGEPDGKLSETATWIRDLASQHHAFRERVDRRQRPMTPRKNPGLGFPRRHPALLVGAASGCDLAAPQA